MSRIVLLVTCMLLLQIGCVSAPNSQAPVSAHWASESDNSPVNLNGPVSATNDVDSDARPDDADSGQARSDVAPLEKLTVDEAQRIAEANRPELDVLRHRIGMAEGEAQQAGLWPNPIVSLGLEGYTPNGESRPPDLAKLDNLATISNRTRGRASTIQTMLLPDAPSLIPSYELWIPSIPDPRNPDQLQQVVNVSQTLPIWGTPRLARKAGNLETERWKLEYARARQELRSEVEKTFDEVIFRQESLDATQDLEQTLAEIVGVTRSRYEAGDIAEVQLIKGEADHERFLLELEVARSELDRSKSRLARVLGNPILAIRNCSSPTAMEIPVLREDTITTLREGHPQVQTWIKAIEAAEAQIEASESSRWPVPTLGIGYRHYEYTHADTIDISLEFELPLFDRKQGEIKSAREKAKLEMASVRAERNQVETHLQDTLIAFATHRHRGLSYQERILPRMQETLDIVRASFEAGDTGILEVLDAHRSLAESRLAALREIHETRAAYCDLKYLLGLDATEIFQ